jgi:hypothetical protein
MKRITKALTRLLLRLNSDGVMAALQKGKKHWKEMCEVAFDLEGRTYYQFTDSGNIPLVRYKEMQAILINLESRLSSEELTKLIEIARNSIVQAIEGSGRKDRGNGLQTALWTFQEIEYRHKSIGLHTDLILDLAALHLIRDDENPFEINEQIRADKRRLFEGNFADHAFFLRSGMNAYLPKVNELESVWQELWTVSSQKVADAKTAYKTIASEISSMNG